MIIQPADLIACLDFETLGSSGGTVPVELGVVRMNGRGEILSHWEAEFAPGMDVLAGGRPNERLPRFEASWPIVQAQLDGAILCAHNVGFERSVLTDHFPLFRPPSYLDTLAIYRRLYAGRVSEYSLGPLLQTMGLTGELASMALNDHFVAHRALYDAAGCALLLRRVLLDPALSASLLTAEQGSLF